MAKGGGGGGIATLAVKGNGKKNHLLSFIVTLELWGREL